MWKGKQPSLSNNYLLEQVQNLELFADGTQYYEGGKPGEYLASIIENQKSTIPGDGEGASLRALTDCFK